MIEIKIIDTGGNVVGAGPVTGVTGVSITEPIDRIGSFSFEMPAGDEKAGLLTAQKRISVRSYDAETATWTEIGDGIIKDRGITAGADGMAMMNVSGPGLAQELADDIVMMSLTGSDGVGVFDAPAQILSAFPGWSLDASGRTTTETRFYGAFNGESGAEALIAIAEKLGEHFVFLPGRKVRWLGSSILSSGVRATDIESGSLDEAGDVIAIDSLELTAAGGEIVTRIKPYGAGDGEARLTLAASTRGIPTGWSIHRINNEITNVPLESQIGRVRRALSFSDIAPVSNSDTDLRAASDQLATAAIAYMQQHAQEQRSYQIGVVGLRGDRVRPGESMRVDYDSYEDGSKLISIHEELVILSVTKEISADGVPGVATSLEVATTAAWLKNDTQIMAQAIREQIAAQAHPQLSANCWWLSFSPRMDKSNRGTITFWLTKELVTVNEITLYFKILPLESSIKSIGGKQTTSGPSSSSTSAVDGGGAVTSGPSTRETSDSAKDTIVGQGLAGANTIHIGQQGVAGETDPGAASWNHKHASGSLHVPEIYAALPDHQHWITLQGHKHKMDHTHTVTIPSHSHGMNHTHEFTAEIKTEYGIFRNSTGKTLTVEELTISANGQAVGTIENAGGGWYKVDITARCTNAIGRPTKENHSIIFATESEDKSALIDAKLKVRSVIQAIAYL